MAAQGLTDSKIRALQPPLSGQAEYRDLIVPGLRLRIGVSGLKVFILRKRSAGRVRTITLGRYHESRYTLAVARRAARTLISDIEIGNDPPKRIHLRRRPSGDRPTVKKLVDAYLMAKAHLRSIAEVRRIFHRDVLPVLGDRMADSVTRAEITGLIDSIERPVMARAVAAQLGAFYTWAMPRLPGLQGNPARDAGRPSRPKARERVLSDPELKALWSTLREEPPPFGPALRLLIITLQRRDEVFSADRSEFDRETKTWTIPADRAKNGRAHLVPLSPLAMAELDAVGAWRGTGKLFPARGNDKKGASGFSKAWARIRDEVDKRLGAPAERFTIHDLRRTGATGLQRCGVPLPVTEAVLNHVSGSRAGIVGVYQLFDYRIEKCAAMNLWSEDLEGIFAGTS